YYVVKVSDFAVKLALTHADAVASSPVVIDLAAGATGANHSLQIGVHPTGNTQSTFDPSTSVSGNTITFHDVDGFTQGQKVVYNSGLTNAAPIGGLSEGQTYYIKKIDAFTIELLASLGSMTPINLNNSAATGVEHSLTIG